MSGVSSLFRSRMILILNCLARLQAWIEVIPFGCRLPRGQEIKRIVVGQCLVVPAVRDENRFANCGCWTGQSGSPVCLRSDTIKQRMRFQAVRFGLSKPRVPSTSKLRHAANATLPPKREMHKRRACHIGRARGLIRPIKKRSIVNPSTITDKTIEGAIRIRTYSNKPLEI